MKVLHCPTDIGGNPHNISLAERKLGIESETMVFRSRWFNYPSDINLHLEKYPFPIKVLKVMQFFREAIRKYDVFHFNFGQSILDYPRFFNHLDLPLLKRRGKKIIITYQGCDARTTKLWRDEMGRPICDECDNHSCYKHDDNKIFRIGKVSKYADKAYVLNPDLLYSVKFAEFMPYAIYADEWKIQKEQQIDDGKIRILHAPTSRALKGTKYVIDACKKLNLNGYPVELMLVENIPHTQVNAYYSKADIVIDQLIFGWYGAFAVETMALNKPVLCYLNKEDVEKFVPFKDKIPIKNTSTATLYDDLLELITDKKLRQKIGSKGRAFVEDVHSPVKIAKRLIEDAYE